MSEIRECFPPEDGFEEWQYLPHPMGCHVEEGGWVASPFCDLKHPLGDMTEIRVGQEAPSDP